MATFKSAFKVIEKAAGDNADVYRKTFSVNILRKIARNTPVDTGRATGNWIIQGGTPNLTPMHRYDQSVTAGPTVDQAKRDVKKIPKKKSVKKLKGRKKTGKKNERKKQARKKPGV